MDDLTDRQKEVLRFVLSFRDDHGRTPSGPEIADHFGYSDPSSAYQHLRLIAKKDYLNIHQPGKRGPLRIVPTDKAETAATQEWPVFGAIPAGPVTDVPADDTVSVRSIQDLLPMIQPDDYFLTVSGDSMKDAGLEEGMTLLMRPTEDPSSDVSPGDVCAVWVDGDGGTLKRVYFENGHVRLVPENDAYDVRVEPADRVRIQGVLVAALSVIPFRNGG
jgi:repressor LexA